MQPLRLPFRASLIGLSLVAALGGCALAPQNDAAISAQHLHAKAAFDQTVTAKPAAPDVVDVVDRPYIAGLTPVAVQSKATSGLPASLADRDVTLLAGSPKSLTETVSMMAGDLGLPIRLDATVSGDAKADAKADQRLALAFSGKLPDLLNLVTTRFGVFWSYENGAIVVSRYETHIYHLPQAFAGTTDVSGSIGGGNGGSGASASGGTGSSGGTLNSTVQSQVSVKTSGSIWKSLEDSVKSVINKEGDVTASPDLGILVVRTTPQRMLRVGDLVQAARDILGRKVMLRMQVYSVSLTRNESAGFNLNAVLKSALDSHGITTTIGGGVGTVAGAGSIGFSVLNGGSTPSTALIQALSTLGNVSTVYDNPVTTQNGQAVPISNVVSQGYAASTQTTVTANVGSTTSITPGTVTYGYAMTVLPRIIDDKEIALQVQLNISNLLQLQTFGASGNQIQLPTVQSEPFIQRTLVRDGQTVMLMGLQQVALQANENGTVTPQFWALGGGSNAQSQKQLLVVLVTPEIMN